MNLRRSRRQIFLWMLGRRSRHQVQGSSMLPCLVHGDTVLIHASHKNLHAGDIVLVRHPHKNVTIVKRIAKIHADGRLELLGDNPPESTDSRHFGFVSVDAVLGKVVSRFP